MRSNSFSDTTPMEDAPSSHDQRPNENAAKRLPARKRSATIARRHVPSSTYQHNGPRRLEDKNYTVTPPQFSSAARSEAFDSRRSWMVGDRHDPRKYSGSHTTNEDGEKEGKRVSKNIEALQSVFLSPKSDSIEIPCRHTVSQHTPDFHKKLIPNNTAGFGHCASDHSFTASPTSSSSSTLSPISSSFNISYPPFSSPSIPSSSSSRMTPGAFTQSSSSLPLPLFPSPSPFSSPSLSSTSLSSSSVPSSSSLSPP